MLVVAAGTDEIGGVVGIARSLVARHIGEGAEEACERRRVGWILTGVLQQRAWILQRLQEALRHVAEPIQGALALSVAQTTA